MLETDDEEVEIIDEAEVFDSDVSPVCAFPDLCCTMPAASAADWDVYAHLLRAMPEAEG